MSRQLLDDHKEIQRARGSAVMPHALIKFANGVRRSEFLDYQSGPLLHCPLREWTVQNLRTTGDPRQVSSPRRNPRTAQTRSTTPGPVIDATRLCGGPVGSSRRTANLVAETLSWLSRWGAGGGAILLRAWPMSSTMGGTRTLGRMARPATARPTGHETGTTATTTGRPRWPDPSDQPGTA